jgi:hypothetical protein
MHLQRIRVRKAFTKPSQSFREAFTKHAQSIREAFTKHAQSFHKHPQSIQKALKAGRDKSTTNMGRKRNNSGTTAGKNPARKRDNSQTRNAEEQQEQQDISVVKLSYRMS